MHEPAQRFGKLPEHLPRLDVLRAIAILLVFSHHYLGAYFDAYPAKWNELTRDYEGYQPGQGGNLLASANLGWIGVPLFFVISGFCIHYGYLRRPNAFNITNFYWRRFARIYPAYFVALLVLAVINHAHLLGLLAHLLLVHNMFHGFLSINSDFWSLAIEFQFYLLYPLIILTRSKVSLLHWLVIALVLSVLLQMIAALIQPYPDIGRLPVNHLLWSNPFSTWCDWILGACLAEAYARQTRLFHHTTLMMGVSLLAFIVSDNFEFLHWQAYLFSSVFFCALMDWYLNVKTPILLFERILIPIGIVSYSFYLWHDPLIGTIGRLASSLLPPGVYHSTSLSLLAMPLTFLLILPIAVISYYLFEKGASGYLRRYSVKTKTAAYAPLSDDTLPTTQN